MRSMLQTVEGLVRDALSQGKTAKDMIDEDLLAEYESWSWNFITSERMIQTVVDELEASQHPLLALWVVQQFNSPRTNPHNAQLLFTTHDTHLLGSVAGAAPLRRDQVWLTEKDGEGATVLYPLTDYKPRKAENLERGYLHGRYGAIPFLGDLARVEE